ncbi:MAG: SDR family NAD(P)-dependent oxidoreductase [Roseibium sp.]|uniref:SDR family NAD(P)-dependent oxidoreductase n=1 Tax=Roseibium sp. TaxID=1936156 RepID=UPI001B295A32|nr:SDR family NAD(P)-dependent oxidoreductase [Roseibium sp.]MBO6893546.1 SDR family NAD(P)-dependent oxidoreductase [Roseibium sp.]MBO6929917.1 SDR family NAD(P)-dependent oxidoreductase [Roseibium sp.]
MSRQKTVVITGGAIGLGRELTRLYCEQGHRVLLCGRTKSALEEVRSMHPEAIAFETDLADPDGRRRFVDFIHEQSGSVDLLIHNAALQFPHDFVGGCVPLEKLETEVLVNLLAPIELTTELLPLLKSTGGGRVVFISSALARVPKQSAPVYCATKAGLSNFARALRYQLESTGVSVSDVVPDLIVTRMAMGRGDKALSAFEAAQKIVDELGKGKKEIRLGRVPLLYTLHRLLPDLAYGILRAS